VDHALEVVQIDHTPVDVIVVDEAHRLPIGGPWLTLAIDVATRVVVGFYVSLEAPSSTSVALCLTQGRPAQGTLAEGAGLGMLVACLGTATRPSC
jgi:putative transposase